MNTTGIVRVSCNRAATTWVVLADDEIGLYSDKFLCHGSHPQRVAVADGTRWKSCNGINPVPAALA